MAWLNGRKTNGDVLQVPSLGGLSVPSAEFLGTAYASGKQWYRYEWIEKDQAYGWKHIWADAPLTDEDGATVGHHDFSSGGPTWKCNDDASEVGANPKPVQKNEDHGADNVAWLLLEASTWSGTTMSRVRYVHRVDTQGGTLLYTPDTGVGTEQDADYSATYHFWGDLPGE